MRLSKFTLSTVLKGCANSGNLRGGQFLHSLAIKSGCEIDEFLGCSLIDMYSKCGMAIDAVKVFRRIKNPDVVAWSATITCLDQQGQCQEVAELFREMIAQESHQINLVFLVSSVLPLISKICILVKASMLLHGNGCESDISVSNALITMYMKIGRVLDGAQVFEAMTDRDLISWNSLLSGTHNHEICDLGPRIFHQMLLEGFKPNMYSFISVLRSCSSLLDVGLGKQVHAHIVKTSLDDNDFVGTALIDIHHYGLCQTDQAEKAVACFSQMQQEGVKPNEFALAGCLSACSRIAMLENGRQLHSMAIKSGHLGDLFVSSALLIFKGRWDDVSKVRKLMSSQGVKKEPGCSWVEVDGQVNTFVSQDGSHPRIRDIHLKLEELGEKLNSVGYIPETEDVLHNITKREKNEHLQYHSERLALAFSLISTNPPKTIRIFKNLRICGDCHEVMKLISDVTNREIIVRDVKRFHNFKSGTCSCNDFCRFFCTRVCIYHINPPGHENFAILLAVGSCFDCPDDPVLPIHFLVLIWGCNQRLMCMGVTVGAQLDTFTICCSSHHFLQLCVEYLSQFIDQGLSFTATSIRRFVAVLKFQNEIKVEG
ncbi:pentatricopeptide repeat-containing protein [Prunus yedoensis var. nudiflora]|uniref:Pentatricopeptide repeat-containing protein n=1 Tax=Prunus yedoensis var. nudiflora TaxID=2094558 RepID=A0A314ZD23_PRUYE|nr:pentatricopeptide repeat-containing protein [Prunus yedoensis var. nudiflora]